MKNSEQPVSEEINQFLDSYIQDWGEHGIVNFSFETLCDLLKDFQNSQYWKIDKEPLAELLQNQMLENQMKERQAAYIKHEKEQRLFIAANGAMNGLLAATKDIDNSLWHSGRLAQESVEYAKALLAEIEKESSNQSNQQQ